MRHLDKILMCFVVLVSGLGFSSPVFAARQFGGATYYFDANGNYNGIRINYCNITTPQEETVPGVKLGPYHRSDQVVCSPRGGAYLTTGFDCWKGETDWTCVPVGFQPASARGTSYYLAPNMTMEQSCQIIACDAMPLHDAWYLPVPGGSGLHNVVPH